MFAYHASKKWPQILSQLPHPGSNFLLLESGLNLELACHQCDRWMWNHETCTRLVRLDQKGHAVSPGSLGTLPLGESSCLVSLPGDSHATEATWGAVVDGPRCAHCPSHFTKTPSTLIKPWWTFKSSPSTSWAPLKNLRQWDENLKNCSADPCMNPRPVSFIRYHQRAVLSHSVLK